MQIFAPDVKKVIEPHLFEEALHYFEKYYSSLPTLDGPSFMPRDFRTAKILGIFLGFENRMVGDIDLKVFELVLPKWISQN